MIFSFLRREESAESGRDAIANFSVGEVSDRFVCSRSGLSVCLMVHQGQSTVRRLDEVNSIIRRYSQFPLRSSPPSLPPPLLPPCSLSTINDSSNLPGAMIPRELLWRQESQQGRLDDSFPTDLFVILVLWFPFLVRPFESCVPS
jgi:hypothetical protein